MFTVKIFMTTTLHNVRFIQINTDTWFMITILIRPIVDISVDLLSGLSIKITHFYHLYFAIETNNFDNSILFLIFLKISMQKFEAFL